MGITAGPSYTTEQGFVVSPVYLSITSYRFMRLPDSKFQSVFAIQAFKSREDKAAGRAPLTIPTPLSNAESFLSYADFYRQSMFAHGYDAARRLWQSAGFTVDDIQEPGQPGATQYIYDVSGYNVDGYNSAGYDAEGYDRTGFNAEGYGRDGYGRDGYNAEGYDRQGYDRTGFDKDGYDRYNFDRDGYDHAGFNREGYDRDGYNADGYNAQGLDRDGNPRPTPDLSGNVPTAPQQDLSGNVPTAPQRDLSGNEPPASEPAPEAP